MMKDLRLISIKNEMEFETLCCDLAKEEFCDFAAQKYGRRGQKQWGIDIMATNRKESYEKVVIQCKFKEGYKAPANINKEISDEFEAARKKHEFDIFIYATNLKPDAKEQDYGIDLAKKTGKVITVWFIDDIAEIISRHPRLVRLYSENNTGNTVTLIDQDFVDTLHYQLEHNGAIDDVFQFYSGGHSKYCQWVGILKKYDAPRTLKSEIDTQISDLLHRETLNKRVAAVLLGEGGSGKSTLLRRIAIDNVQNGNYINWWVENLDDFIRYDAYTVSANRAQRHLIIVDDWYGKIQIGQDTSAFFNWLNNQNHVLVLIGDRESRAIYTDHLYGNNKFKFQSTENVAILNHIATVSPDFAPLIQEISGSGLPDRVSIYIILYVLAQLQKDQNEHFELDLKDGILDKFRKIIARKLQILELHPKHTGMGKSLFLLGTIYTSQSMNYSSFSEDFLLHTASFFADSSYWAERAGRGENLPDQVNALVYKREVISKIDKTFVYVHFNHDLLAEQGIVNAKDDDKTGALLDYDNVDLENLLQYLILKGETSSALVLWLWLFADVKKWKEKESLGILLQIFGKELKFVKGALFYHILTALKREESKKIIAHFILDQPEFFKLSDSIVSMSIRILEKDEAGKRAANIILEQLEFFKLPDSIVSTSIRILEKDEAGKRAAKIILKQHEFFKLQKEIVSTSIRILEKDEAGKRAAKIILEQPEFFKLPSEIVSTSIRVLEKNEAGKRAANIILEQPEFFKLTPEIVSTSIRILEKDEAGKRAANIILEQPEFFKLPYSIVSTSIRILEKDEAGKRAAKIILEQPEFFKLQKEILSTSIRILEKDEAGKRAANIILEQPEFFKLPFEIVSTSIRTLEKDEAGKRAAKIILEQPEFFKLPDSIVSTSIRILEKDEAGKRAAKIILEQPEFFKLPFEIVSTSIRTLEKDEAGKRAAKIILEQPEFFKLPDSIVSTSIRILEKDEAGKRAAKIILEQPEFFKLPDSMVSTSMKAMKDEEISKVSARIILQKRNEIHTFLQFHALKTLLSKENPNDVKFIQNVVKDISEKLRFQNKSYDRLYFDLLYLPLFEMNEHRSRVIYFFERYEPRKNKNLKYSIFRVLKCFKDFPDNKYLQQEIKTVCGKIVQACIDDLKYQLENNPREVIFAHIDLAFWHIGKNEMTQAKIKELIVYAEKVPDFKQSDFFERISNPLYPFIEED